MVMTADDIKDLEALLAVAKKGPINFGLCLGKKPEDTVLKLARTKEGKTLAQKAKVDAKGTNICYGTCTVEGNVLQLDCAIKTPANMVKICKDLFKDHKIAFTVKIAKETNATDSDTAHPDTGKWQKDSAALTPLLDGSLPRLAEGPALRAIWDYALAAAEENEIPKALKSLEKLETSLGTALEAHGTALSVAFQAAFAEVEAGLSEAERKDLRAELAAQTKRIGTATARDVEAGFAALTGSLNSLAKAKKGAASATLSGESKVLTAEQKKVQDQIDALQKDADTLMEDYKTTQRNAQKILSSLKGMKNKGEVAKLQAKIEVMKETGRVQSAAANKKAKDIVPLIEKLKKDKTALSQATVARFAELEAQIKGLTQSVAANPFKEIQAELEATIKDMAEASVWREGQDGQGGELRRNAADGTHGSARHGAQTGIERQARRSATEAAPDSPSRPAGVGVTAKMRQWQGAKIEWEEVDGKRKIKSRTEVQKTLVAEIASFPNLPADGTTSVFATPVLEKLAVDTAIAKITAAGWNEVYSFQDQAWYDLTDVIIYVGTPKDYGKKSPGWGYSLSRKDIATMALAAANAVLTKFETGKINETQMLDQLGVEYLTLPDPEKQDKHYVVMVPYAQVILTRANGTSAWKSKTHLPYKTATAEGWSIEGNRVRKSGARYETAKF